LVPGCGAGAQAILDGWSQKIQMVEPEPEFPFNKHSLLGKQVIQIMQWFLVFN